MSDERRISFGLIVPALVCSAAALTIQTPKFLVWCAGVVLGASVAAGILLPLIAERSESKIENERRIE